MWKTAKINEKLANKWAWKMVEVVIIEDGEREITGEKRTKMAKVFWNGRNAAVGVPPLSKFESGPRRKKRSSETSELKHENYREKKIAIWRKIKKIPAKKLWTHLTGL